MKVYISDSIYKEGTMKKKLLATILTAAMTASLLAGCGAQAAAPATAAPAEEASAEETAAPADGDPQWFPLNGISLG